MTPPPIDDPPDPRKLDVGPLIEAYLQQMKDRTSEDSRSSPEDGPARPIEAADGTTPAGRDS